MPAIHDQRIYPCLIDFDETYQHNKSLDFTRSEGLHISTVYTDFCVTAGLLKTWDDEADETGESEWLLHLGLAFEGYMAPRTNVLRQPDYNSIWQPGELSVQLSNGKPVYMTPDMYVCNCRWHVWKTQDRTFPVVDDFKYTMKRTFNGEFPEVWLMQAACYLHAYNVTMNSDEHTRFRYWVMHSKGDYRKKSASGEAGSGTTLPVFMLYSLDYSDRPEEIVKTWEKLDGYAVRNYDRLLEKQIKRHEERVAERNRRKEELLESVKTRRLQYLK